jgi:lambda family phage minor tail protein L
VQPARLASGTGNGASGFYIWGAQLEQASAPTDYQPITDVYQRNPSADPNAYFPDDVFWVERKTAENKQFVEFELSPIWDVSGIMLPRRQYIQNVCSWRYRSAECSYAGGPVATKNDQATSDPVLDVCGKRLASCKLRFGDTAQLPFGGFPGVGLVT